MTIIETSSIQIKHQEEKIIKLSQEHSSKENMQKNLQEAESELHTQATESTKRISGSPKFCRSRIEKNIRCQIKRKRERSS